MKIIVLGAGVIGTTTAYYLAKDGHEVTVIDRQAHAGAETSFANGGQISVSHAEPWANPDAWKMILGSLGREEAPLLFRLRWDLALWKWGLQFLNQCTKDHWRTNIAKIADLALYSRAQLQKLRQETGISYLERTQGIMHFYSNQSEFLRINEPLQIMRSHGCPRMVLDVPRAIEIEPALKHFQKHLVGATYTPEDESGDAHLFTLQLAKRCEDLGVKFLLNTTITALPSKFWRRIEGVEVVNANGRYELLQAGAYVVCLGAYSPLLVRPLGISIPVYPVKGYSITVPVKDVASAYQVSLTDDEHKLVFSRLGSFLRIAGTAELNGYDRSLNIKRCRAIVNRAKQIFPEGGVWENAQFWTGLRPATPSNVPLVKKTEFMNLYLNTGHGTLGWTMACGSAKTLSNLFSNLV